MRGFGAPQGAFATESLISRASKLLGIDPLEIRYKNGIETGMYGGVGQKMRHFVDFKGALKLIEQSELWQERKHNTDPYVGYGIAGGHLSCGLGKNIPDQAEVKIEEADGHYTIFLGLVDIGQGSRTALQAMAADALETDFDNVSLVMADTDRTLDCGSTAGSRSTFIGGNAMLNAIENFKKGEMETGKADFPESEESFSIAGFPHAMYTFIAQAVKLRVDPVTGQVVLLDIAAATTAESTAETAGKKLKVALILPGKKDDVSFNQAMYEGMKKYADANPDKIDLNVTENVYEVADIEPALMDFADQGYDVIFGHGFQFMEPIVKVGAQYPDTYFLLGTGYKSLDNTAIYDVELEAGGYEMGVIAALATQTNKIGVIGGADASEIKRGHEGFKAGAKSINPDIEIQEVYTGDWTDTAGAKEAAIGMYDAGVDVIWHSGDGIGLGVVQAAAEKDMYCLGNVADQKTLAENNVLSGVVYQWDAIIANVFDDINNGTFKGRAEDDRYYWINAENNGLGIADINDPKGWLTDDDKQVIADTWSKLQSGEIKDYLPEDIQ